MIKRLLPYIFLITLVACDKDKDPVETKLPGNLLKTITWDFGLSSNSVYTDSLLQRIDFKWENSVGSTVYNWTGKTLKEIYDDRSIYKHVYSYDNDGKLTQITNTPRSGTLPTGYVLEFEYNNTGKVDSLKYFVINEAGKKLQGASSYSYHSNGELKEVITRSGNSIITHTIDSYSPLVSFNPCHYINPSLDEHYTIYNYAVIRQLKQKLPAKITRVNKAGNEQPYVDNIQENVYTINNYRIEKVVSSTSYPKSPGSNSSMESVYTYY
jgi:hypothetical protein